MSLPLKPHLIFIFCRFIILHQFCDDSFLLLNSANVIFQNVRQFFGNITFYIDFIVHDLAGDIFLQFGYMEKA